MYSGGAVARRRAGGARGPAQRRRDSRPGHHCRGQRHHRRRAGLAGAPDRARPSGARAPRAAHGGVRRRHHGRPGAARGVQQPVHEHRRADGPAAAEHRLLGQHQGAAGFQLRAVRCRRQPDRQRAAHAGAPGLDGREHQDRDPRERARPWPTATSSCSTTPTMAARTCPTSRSSRRSTWTACRRSMSARAATMPTWAAPRPARCRRSRPASRRRACRSTTSSWSTAACCRRRR